MKKKILFVSKDLNSGGAEKSLVSLLSQINYEQYSVDLILLEEGDFFKSSIPDEVNYIGVIKETNLLLSMSAKKSLAVMMKQKKILSFISVFIGHTIYKAISKFFNMNAKIIKWKMVSILIPKVQENYDVAVAYNYDFPIHFVVDKVEAPIKIGWVHGNYDLTRNISGLDKVYFSKLDKIVTVSETCKEILGNNFPYFLSKTMVIENIISPKIINSLAGKELDIHTAENKINILTIARLSAEKGINLAIQAACLLAKEGIDFKWIVIGEGFERDNLEKMIFDFQLEEKFILLGTKKNPYPYIKNADIYVQPSITEGKSIAIEEAKVLGKPIVVTNYSTVADQIINDLNGIVVDIDANSISRGIIRLAKSCELRKKLTSELLHNSKGNEDEVNKLYKIINR